MEEKWTLRYDASTERLFIVAQGFATEEKTAEAAATFLVLLGKRSVDLVIDLNLMTGYNSAARKLWQQSFYPVRSQLRRMLVVGRELPGLVRMGATVVAAFIGVPIRFFRTMQDLEVNSR